MFDSKAQSNVVIESTIRPLEQLVVTRILNGDTNMLKQVWAPQFNVNTPRNNIAENREAAFLNQRAGLINYRSFERNIEKFQLMENVAITMGNEIFVSKNDIPGAKNNG